MSAASPRVVIAEDAEDQRLLLRSVLGRQGLSVVSARDGTEAIDAIDAGGVDLMILDLKMPRASGLAVLRYLTISGRDVPVIVLTATEGMQRLLAEGGFRIDAYLTKPVDHRDVIARVRDVLSAREGP
jgi:adenylate cyclase